MRSTYITPSPPRLMRAVLVTLALLVAVGTAAVVLVSTHLPLTAHDSARGSSESKPVDLGSLDVDDGYIELGESISPFADELPSIARLDPQLRQAMQAAARDAIADGVDFVVTSGWRSERYQQALFDDAVRNYGSVDEAEHWVASATTSAHVTGQAVDIGYTDADSWLSQHGADYGLCQVFANEMWHFELATTPGGDCPPQVPDASYG